MSAKGVAKTGEKRKNAPMPPSKPSMDKKQKQQPQQPIKNNNSKKAVIQAPVHDEDDEEDEDDEDNELEDFEDDLGIDAATAEILKKSNEFQDSIDSIDDEMAQEIILIEQKYAKKKQPLYNQRDSQLEQIKGFWATIFAGNDSISELLDEFDHELLEHLTCISIQEHQAGAGGYKLIWKFSENPFFSNLTLSKDIEFSDEEGISVTATAIQWKNKNIPTENADSLLVSYFDADQSSEEHQMTQLCDIIRTEIYKTPILCYAGILAEQAMGSDDGEDDEEDDEAPELVDA